MQHVAELMTSMTCVFHARCYSKDGYYLEREKEERLYYYVHIARLPLPAVNLHEQLTQRWF